jgi:hypothetical protein
MFLFPRWVIGVKYMVGLSAFWKREKIVLINNLEKYIAFDAV